MKYINSKTGDLIAIVVEKDFQGKGINFVTDDESPLQMGVNFYKKGDVINPHYHLHAERVIKKLQEMVFIQEGKATVDLYDLNNNKFQTEELCEGDSIFFVDGGHGFKLLENTKIIEIKQGPYMGKNEDKKEIK